MTSWLGCRVAGTVIGGLVAGEMGSRDVEEHVVERRCAQRQRPHRHAAPVERNGHLGNETGTVGRGQREFVVVRLHFVDPVDRPQRLGGNGDVAVDFGNDQIGTDGALEIGRRALGLDPSVGDDSHPVGQLVGFLQVLRRQEDRGAELFVQPPHLGPHRGTTRRVEPGRRFIEEQDLRPMDQRHREVESTLHPAGVRVDSIVDGGADVDEADHGVHPGGDVSAVQPVQATLQRKHLPAGLLAVDRVVLQRHADAQADVTGLRRDVEAGDGCRSRRDAEQCAQHLHRGRLTGTVRAEEAVDLAVRDVEVDAGHRIVGAERSCEGVGLDCRWHQASRRPSMMWTLRSQ